MTTVGPHSLKDEEVEAFIFDVDGTLLNTMPLFLPSWYVTCDEFGLTIDEHQFYHFAGLPLPTIVHELHQEQKNEPPTEEFIQQFLKKKKKSHAAHEAKHGGPEKIDCVVRIALEAKKQGRRLACATSGLRVHVEKHLKEAGIFELFEHIVCAEDLPKGRGKPNPDIFLEAAKKLGTEPHKCRAFEDGESGLEAAYKAGMHVIDVRDIPGYPMHDALHKVMHERRKSRTWLD
mmetsp:Transcript_2728/g.3192  ORF Transcript_2728/g.3192 Transcript_2728/m.3192 type:complete len:232 (-) Transcript_2728:424-1119(-)